MGHGETHIVNAAHNVNAEDQCQNDTGLLQHGRVGKYMEHLLETTYRQASPVDASRKSEGLKGVFVNYSSSCCEECRVFDGCRSEIESGGITWLGYSKLHRHTRTHMHK